MKFLGLLFISFMAVLPAAGQNHGRGTIRVDVIYANGGHAPAQLRVRLNRGMNGTVVAVANTDSLGTVEFSDLDPGQYQAVVSGDGIETSASNTIEVSDWNVFQSQVLVIRPSTTNNDTGGRPTIEVSDLSIPSKAAKEYNRGNEEMLRKNWAKAAERFQKAIELYPTFSAAYNNLAVSYSQLGQRDLQRKTLEKIISINERFVPALVNLSDMDMQDRNYSAASSLLDRALKIDPNNVEALTYLSQIDLAQGQYDLAITAAHKAHGLSHKNFAIVHFTAASAFERQGQINDAIAELETFLQESPQGPNADAARKAITGLQRHSQ